VPFPVAFHHRGQRQARLAAPAVKPLENLPPSGLVDRLQYRRWFEPAQKIEPMLVLLSLEFILQLVNSQKRATV
jgi:hypothetical protein